VTRCSALDLDESRELCCIDVQPPRVYLVFAWSCHTLTFQHKSVHNFSSESSGVDKCSTSLVRSRFMQALCAHCCQDANSSKVQRITNPTQAVPLSFQSPPCKGKMLTPIRCPECLLYRGLGECIPLYEDNAQHAD
jgi:hypothetical protein